MGSKGIDTEFQEQVRPNVKPGTSDLGPPGLSATKRLDARRRGPNVLMAAALGEVATRTVGLVSGVDDDSAAEEPFERQLVMVADGVPWIVEL